MYLGTTNPPPLILTNLTAPIYGLQKPLDPGTYYWSVTAVTAAGGRSAPSPVYSFDIPAPSSRSQAPALLSTIRLEAQRDGLEIVWEKQGELDTNGVMNVPLGLFEAGYEYAIQGLCDSGCQDLDLTLLDGLNRKIDEDVDDDPAPVVTFTPVTRDNSVQVRMVACGANPCEWVIVGARRPAGRVGPTSTSVGSHVYDDANEVMTFEIRSTFAPRELQDPPQVVVTFEFVNNVGAWQSCAANVQEPTYRDPNGVCATFGNAWQSDGNPSDYSTRAQIPYYAFNFNRGVALRLRATATLYIGGNAAAVSQPYEFSLNY